MTTTTINKNSIRSSNSRSGSIHGTPVQSPVVVADAPSSNTATDNNDAEISQKAKDDALNLPKRPARVISAEAFPSRKVDEDSFEMQRRSVSQPRRRGSSLRSLHSSGDGSIGNASTRANNDDSRYVLSAHGVV